METATAQPVRKGFFRRLMSWRGALFFLAAFVTLVALLWAEENWRGERAWQNFKRTMEAKGESFDPARLIPPAVPDDQNLATIPFLTTSNTDVGPLTGLPDQFVWPEAPPHEATWHYPSAAELIGWAKAFHGPADNPAKAASTVYNYLQKHEPVLTELESARQRPYCRFNIPYDDRGNLKTVNETIPQFARIKDLIRMLALRAQAELVMGRTDQALDDINIMFRLDDGLRNEPFLMSQLVRIAAASIMLQPVGEGLAEHHWSDAQLRVLQERLQKTGVMECMVLALYGERDIFVNQTLDRGGYFPTAFPSGWARLEQLNFNRAFDEMVVPRFNLAGEVISPNLNRSLDLAVHKMMDHALIDLALIRHLTLSSMLAGAVTRTAEHTAFTQNEMNLATLACALERYHLAEGHYPEKLDALVPRFVTELPHDIINGEPLKYHRTSDGRFALYSIGWNEKDDGGVVALNKGKHQDQMNGDWVWEYPATN